MVSNRLRCLLLLMVVAGMSACRGSSTDVVKTTTPAAEKRAHVTTIHGAALTDDYFWLRDKADPRVMAYLHAEEAYTDAIMQPTMALRDKLYQEALSHVTQTDDTVPYLENGYFYYTRTREGLAYPIYCRKRGSLAAPEEIILDVNELAKGQQFVSIGARVVSDDGKFLAYIIDTVGYRQYRLQVKDLRTGTLLADRAERVDAVVWARDKTTLFYVTEDPVTKRADKFWRHVVGTDKDVLVYEEKDETFDVSCRRTRDQAVILLQVFADGRPVELRYIAAERPADKLRVIVPRRADREYDADHRGDRFYIRTNQGAKNFRVVTAPVDDPAHWTDFVPHRPAVKIEQIHVFANYLALSIMENGLPQLEVISLSNGERRRVSYPDPIYAVSLGENAEFSSTTLRYRYQSLVTPPSVFDYNMTSGTSVLMKQTRVPGGFDRSNYAAERQFATASDGTRIPLSIVYRKTVPRDGTAPLLLVGYGAYGYSAPVSFNTANLFQSDHDPILPLLDRGVIYAIAHIRGGGELGEDWRESGRLQHKLNTFTDFIASAEYLVAQKYTASDRLVLRGASAGGLLVSAVANMRPDLFKAVIADVPFADVVNDMLDASLPLTTSEYVEWGNPNEKSAFEYMLRYSPYENVRSQAYPALLVKVSVNDSQVGYWEGAKFVAKLRALKTDTNPLLLKVNFGAGHGGASGRYDALHDTAFEWAFLLRQVGAHE